MKWCYFLLPTLISFSSICQSTSSSNRGAGSDTTRVQELIRLSRMNQWINPNRSLQYADQALLLSQELDYNKGVAAANNLKGFCFWTFGDNDLAIEAALLSLEISQRKNYPLIQAESYYILARGYMDMTEGAKAEECISKAEDLAYDRVDSALYFYTKAFDTVRDHAVDSVNFPRIISNIGECYEAENPKLAGDYYSEALSMAKRTGNQIAEASISDVIGHFHLGEKGPC